MRLTTYKIQLVKEDSCNYGTKDYQIKNSWDVVSFLRDVYKLHLQAEEVFYCICLNTKNKVIGVHEVSRGSINSATVHPREVFKRVLLNNANKVIFAHNHPSGDVSPSESDKKLTKRLFDCGEILGVEVLDHIIVGDTYFSFKENFLLS